MGGESAESGPKKSTRRGFLRGLGKTAAGVGIGVVVGAAGQKELTKKLEKEKDPYKELAERPGPGVYIIAETVNQHPDRPPDEQAVFLQPLMWMAPGEASERLMSDLYSQRFDHPETPIFQLELGVRKRIEQMREEAEREGLKTDFQYSVLPPQRIDEQGKNTYLHHTPEEGEPNLEPRPETPQGPPVPIQPRSEEKQA